jgi:hypothetical protein
MGGGCFPLKMQTIREECKYSSDPDAITSRVLIIDQAFIKFESKRLKREQEKTARRK